MRFSFTDDQLALRQAVRQVLDNECSVADLRRLADGDGGPGRGRWNVLAEMGAVGLLAGEEDGGMGLSEIELVGVLEEAGWAALPEPLAESAALAVPLLASTRSSLLAEVAAGSTVATVGGLDVAADQLAVTTGELNAQPVQSGSPVRSGQFRTERVVGADGADLFLLFAPSSDASLELHAVPRSEVVVISTPSIDPTRDLGSVTWTPTSATKLADAEEAAAMATATASRAAVATAAQLLGLSDRMIAIAADYARQRQQFGRPIGSFQAVKHLLANARVKLEFARPVTYRAAYSLAHDAPPVGHDASMAKAMTSDAADLAARVALQVHGAIGYTWECDLHYFMKRAWVLSASWGDAPTHRARVLAAALAARGAMTSSSNAAG